MDIENAASSEIPSSCHKKKKRKRQDVGKNVEANNAFLEGTSSAKDTPLEPPIKTCKIEVPRNADAMMIEPPTNVILEKKTKKKKSKTSDDCKMISTDHKSASLVKNASVNGTPLEPSINVCPITVPTNVEDTTSDPLANVASEKKKRKKKKEKRRASDNVIDDEHISLENSASAKYTTQESPLDIHTVVVATKAKAITLEPPAGVTSEKKIKKKKKKESKIIDDIKTNATDHESASMNNSASAKDTTWEHPLDIHTAAVTTKAEARASETLASATSDMKKKSKRTDDVKMNDIDHKSASLEHSTSVEDTTWEPPFNTNTVTVPTTSEATMLDSTNVTSEKKRKKKKKKRSEDFKMDSTAHKSASLDALAKDTPMEPLVNVCIIADPAKAGEVTTLEPSTNVTSEKKKQKKKRKASSDAKICAADHGCTPLESSASVKDTPLDPAVNICTTAAPTKEMEVTTLEPPTNVTLEKKKKRKKHKVSSSTKMDAIDHEGAKLENSASAMNTSVMPSVNFSVITVPREVESMTLEPPADVASAKKKKKKKSKTSDDSKLNAIDHKSASLETGVSEEYLCPESVDGIVTVANPESCLSQSLLGKELVVTSEKKRKRSRSKDPSTYNIENENLNGATLKPIVVESEQQNLEFPNQIINGKTTTLEYPTPNSDLGCSEEQREKRHRKKRTGKKKNEQAMRQNVQETNDKVFDGSVHSLFKSSVETRPKAEPECAQSGLSHKMVEEKEQRKFNALEIDDMDHALQQNVVIPSQGVFVTVAAGLNSTGMNKKSPTSEEQSILSNGVNNGSAKKRDGYTKVCDVFESQELEEYNRRKNYHPKVSKSSGSGDQLQPVEDKDDIDTSSSCLVKEKLSASLDNQFEKTSSRIDVDSEQDADVLIERDSFNRLDNETESGDREERMKMSNLRMLSNSNGVFEQKNGGMLVTRHDAFKGENPSCKENGSSDLSKLDAVKIEITREEDPSSSNYGEVEDVVHLDAVLKGENTPQMPNALPERSLVVRSKKKLLILDVNGILVEFVSNVPNYCRPHIRISKKGVFKRPYCDDFLQFCFDRFNIAVWSSRMKCNMDKVVNFLFNQTRHKLLFCWDQSHCTLTGLNTIENTSKPLVLKELRKVWEKVEPDLPFEKGEYDETNTLLLDDSPYKALRNPAHTGVFPFPYNFENRQDNSLGPGGDLRTYLEGLSLADNVREYVEQNPFGQGAITKSHKQWGFYCKIVSSDEPVSKL